MRFFPHIVSFTSSYSKDIRSLPHRLKPKNNVRLKVKNIGGCRPPSRHIFHMIIAVDIITDLLTTLFFERTVGAGVPCMFLSMKY
ncbi:hypothetical protein Desti_1150 [Desulfomonile tiedjei DSM 6799]|uniref:Uncharacterized protein n=1 Tax=Desulfomonile tiedjei (strain ATCC 49306 / DSM 6799 / DCB-1) TaxID=706587 RepID=I4C2S2_DESTA|nr:hypothetical protein Desti_1150 [Desulfomonile tiedjei DSM 6799]